MRAWWARLKRWQKWTLAAGALVLLVALAGSEGEDEPTDRASRGGSSGAKETPGRATTPTPTADAVKVAARFRLRQDSYGVFRTRSSRALVVGRVTPARSVKLYWELRKVPGARVMDSGTVRSASNGRFRFAVLGLRRGEHRVLVDAAPIARNSSAGASVPIIRQAPKPQPTPEPTPESTAEPTPEPTPEPEPACHPSYEGACLDPNSPDYDCQGGSGDGPDYTGTVRVVGDDPFDLDRDGDGIACDP